MMIKGPEIRPKPRIPLGINGPRRRKEKNNPHPERSFTVRILE
jgi:hypothetical protein